MINIYFVILQKSDPISLSLQRISKWSLKSRSLVYITVLLFCVFGLAELIGRESLLFDILNIIALVAGIASFLHLFVYERSG